MTSRAFWRGFGLVFALCVLMTAPCHAQEVFDTVLTKYQTAVSSWTSAFYVRANWVFWTLAIIELTWIGITLAMRQADIQEIVGDLVKFIMITGFFYALLINGTTWMPAIIQSFRDAGNAANVAAGATANMSPSSVMETCLQVSAKVCDSGSWFNPASKVFVGLFGIVILLVGAYIGMLLVCAIVESYIVISAGMLLLGFGSSRWTREYATKILTYSVSVGVKLMLMQLIIGLGELFLSDFATAFNGLEGSFNIGDTAPILVALVVLAGLVRTIPSIAQSMITGVSHGHGGGFGAAVTAGAYAMQAAKAATAVASGGTSAVVAAAQLASAQGAAKTGAAGSTGAASSGGGMGLGSALLRGASFAGRVAGNLAKSAATDVKEGMKGNNKPSTNQAQRMTGRMVEATATQKAANASKQNPPPAPPPSTPPSNGKA